MIKRGLDQTMAWLLAIFLAGAVFGVGYGGVKYLAKKVGHAESLISPEHGEGAGGHAAEPAKAPEADGSRQSHGVPEHGSAEGHGETKQKEPEPASGSSSTPSGHSKESEAAPKATSPTDHAATKAADGAQSARTIPAEGRGDAAEPTWDYKGSYGPSNWGDLSAHSRLCNAGKAQSPIDIDNTTTNDKLLPIRFHYKPSEARLVNNGRMLHLVFAPGTQAIEVEGELYQLRSIELHAPAEHRINNLPYEFELELHHVASDGKPLSISILFEEGNVHKALERLLEKSPSLGQLLDVASVNPADFLPPRRTYYRYEGSLTSPPCTERVTWLVLTQSLEISARQVDFVIGTVGGSSSRPLQARNGRRILKSSR